MPRGTSLAIRALGPYGGSAPGYRLTTFLVDGESALDAGALTDALPLSAQRRIRRVFLTHAHFDHIASLPLLDGEPLRAAPTPLEILAPAPVLAAIARDVLNDRDLAGLHEAPVAGAADRPAAAARRRAGRSAPGPSTFTPFAVSHVVPAYGYIVAKPGRVGRVLRRHGADGPALGGGAARAEPEGDLPRALLLRLAARRRPRLAPPDARARRGRSSRRRRPACPSTCTT